MALKNKISGIGDIGGLAIGIGSAVVIVAIMIIIVGSVTTNLPSTGIGNYSALLYTLESYAKTSFGMVMLGILVAASMFIVWLVGGGGR